MTINNVQPKPSIIKSNLPQLGLIALFSGAAAIAFSPIFVRLSQAGPISTAFWRMALALPFLWIWLTFEKRRVPASPKPFAAADYRWLIAAGLCFAGDLATWHLSLNFTTVANSVLLANLAPVFVTLGSWLIFRQRPTTIFIAGMITAIAGAATLIGASFSLSTDHLLGDAIALGTAVFYGGYILCVKRLRDTLSTATVMVGSGLVAACILLPIALLTTKIFLPFTAWGWLILLGLALFSHAGGQGLVAYALASLPAAFSAVSLLIQPVLSTILAWIILNEIVGPQQAFGGIIVLAGIFIARQGSR